MEKPLKEYKSEFCVKIQLLDSGSSESQNWNKPDTHISGTNTNHQHGVLKK